MSLRSRSDKIALLRSGPAMTRSMASSIAAMLICLPLVRAVSRAASLITLARSAPVKPGVRRAMTSRSASGAIGLPRAGTRRMPLRPARAGRGPQVWGVGGAGSDRLAPGVHPQDALAADQVGLGHHDLAVEAARAQQGRVQDVRPVGGGDHDHAALGVEPVQLDQHLVQGLLALVVATAEAGAAVP